MTTKEKNSSTNPPIIVKESKTSQKKIQKDKILENTKNLPENLIVEKLSWTGKLFFAGVAAYLAGEALEVIRRNKMGSVKESDGNELIDSDSSEQKPFPFKIKGTPQQIQAFTQVIMSSKEFQDEVRRPGATVDSVMQKLTLHDNAKKNFKELTGYEWPLP